jgi:hypothetical protein
MIPYIDTTSRLVALAVALALGACPGDSPPIGTPDTTTGDTTIPQGDAADASTDAPVGDQTGDLGPSVQLCTADTDCTETGAMCACTGECVVVTANPCNTDINCNPGDFCDPCTSHCAALSSLCEACTGLSACADGGTCMPFSDGGTFCGLACLTDAGCPTGYTCAATGAPDKQCLPKSGSCTDLGLCENDGDCTDGEICNEVLQVCAPGCDDDLSCPNDQLCVAARCSDPCTDNAQCESPKECTDGRCKIPGACDSSADCIAAATYCNKNSGTCVPGCLEDDHCKDAAQKCDNGACVPKGCTHNYQCSFEEECDKPNGQCIPMTKDHCAPCDAMAENQCGGDPNLCVSFSDADDQPQGDFCLLECEDDETDQCPQAYGCQQIEVDGVPTFYCVRQCWQNPVSVP